MVIQQGILQYLFRTYDFLFDLGTLKSREYKLRSKDNIAVFRSQDSGKTNRSERIN
jgi:hypothetical protein